MKIKHIAAIFVYFATFTLSVLIVGLPTSVSRSYKKPCFKSAPPVASAETDLQVRIRKFLEADLQTGIELTNDKVRLSHSHSRLKAEKIATINLVEKMSKVKCDGLPADFCEAWKEHRFGWRDKASLLEQDLKSKESTAESRQEHHEMINREISRTYQDMLAAARRHGVDFKY